MKTAKMKQHGLDDRNIQSLLEVQYKSLQTHTAKTRSLRHCLMPLAGN
ncbi:MAG TPA: hypothetical protein V6C98_02410 [Thermosynechococcaceae cyanobacterium]